MTETIAALSRALHARRASSVELTQDARQRLREDRVTERDERSLHQTVAPAVEDGLYLVPKVIE